MAQGVKNLPSIYEDVGSIPVLAQWVKDLAFLQAVLEVADLASIWHCCGHGVGWQLHLRFTPLPGNFHMLQVRPLKKNSFFLSTDSADNGGKPECIMSFCNGDLSICGFGYP